ncbi:MAG: hydantoinase B/oxoprolinase family protein [Burkholderiales bacterium]
MKLDPILLEILGNKVTAVAEEMGITLQRTGRTIYVKSFRHGAGGLGGEFFGFPQRIGVIGFVGLNCARTLAAFDSFEPGDVVMTNHPYRTSGLKHALAGYRSSLISPETGSSASVGASSTRPTSAARSVELSPSMPRFPGGSDDPPVKLLKAGVWNDDVLDLYMANCRTAELNRGDIQAMLAALEVGERRVREMVEDYGLERVVDAQEDLLSYSEEGARRALQRVPDGRYEFWDYLDDGLVNSMPVRIRVELTVRDGRIRIDFAGSDAEATGPLNIPTDGAPHPWLVLRVVAFAHSYAPDVVVNGGMLRNVTVAAPRGSIVHPEFPAPVAVRAATGLRVYDAVNGALAVACPGDLPACPSGTVVPVVLIEPTELSAETRVAVIQFMVGATGARDGADGIDGRDPGLSSMANNPTEVIERETSITVLDYGVRPDSGGAGRFRGGCGQRYRFRVEKDHCVLLARGIERMRFPPWGIDGGLPGERLRMSLTSAGGVRRELGKFETLDLDRGDIVEILMPGGGGCGPPFERDPAAVARDVAEGFVSATAARRAYGVVLRGGAVDVAATKALRAKVGGGTAGRGFSFGREREIWERVFTPKLQTRIAEILYRLPRRSRVAARTALQKGIAPALAGEGARGQPLDRVLGRASVRDVRAAVARLESGAVRRKG